MATTPEERIAQLEKKIEELMAVLEKAHLLHIQRGEDNSCVSLAMQAIAKDNARAEETAT